MERAAMPATGLRLIALLLALMLTACQPQDELDTRIVTSAHGETAAVAVESAAPTDKREAIRRASLASGKRYFIEFRSRYALSYGHTFVIFGRLNEKGEMIDPQVAGLAPKSDDPSVYLAGHLMPVASSTGWTDGDLEDEYMTANWRVMLTEDEYNEVVAEIRKLQASAPVWHAALYNCNAFVGDIAQSMGYRASFHWLRPREYVTRLREINGGRSAIGMTAPTDRRPPGTAWMAG